MKYIVLVAVSIGGAERRFFDIFRSLSSRRSDVRLLISARLYDLLSEKISSEIGSKIIVIGKKSDGLIFFCIKYAAWVMMRSNKNSHFHYPTNCLFFLHFFRSHSVSISLTNCYYPPSFWTKSVSRFRQYISFLFVDRVDVLSPSIYNVVKKYQVLKRKPVSVTPNGTYVFPDPALPDVDHNIIMQAGYVGRLVEGKGVDEFLLCVEDLWSYIKRSVPKGFRFYVAGFGPLECAVVKMVDRLRDNGVPISFLGYVDPDIFFKETPLLMSMQAITNYPSRVVAEARLSGCTVLIRDTGDSRNFGQPAAGLDYFPKNFDIVSLGDLIVRNICHYRNDSNRRLLVSEKARMEYSSPAVLEYFEAILSD